MDSKYSLEGEVSPPVFTPVVSEADIITTPLVEQSWQLFENCRIAQALGVIQGPSGTGKTWALKAIQKRFAQAQLPGSVSIVSCCQASGPSSGVRSILLEMGLGGSVLSNRTVAGLHYLLKLAQREISQRGVKGILLDDADSYAVDTIGGIVSLFNHLKETGHPVTILFAGVLPEERWISQLPAAATRTLHIERAEAMSAKLMAAVLKKMRPPMPSLVAAYQNGNKDAGKILRLIHQSTGGVFRRVRFFSDLAAEKTPSTLTLETAEAILGQMQN